MSATPHLALRPTHLAEGMRPVAPIATRRLVLRPLTQADAQRVADLVGDFEVARMVTSIPHPNPLAATEGWLLMLEARAALGRDLVLGVETPADGLVGCIGAHALGDGRGDLELGYWIGRPYWARGYATEAARALVAHLSGVGRDRLVAGHFVDNPASGRVLSKAGFIPTGELRPRFSLARRGPVLCRMMRREAVH